jgi:hypothetical protein
MYPSTFAHLDSHYAPPTHDVATPSKRRSGSRRGLRARLPVLALRPVSPHSACGESR